MYFPFCEAGELWPGRVTREPVTQCPWQYQGLPWGLRARRRPPQGIFGVRRPVPGHDIKFRRAGITRMVWQIP